MIRSRVPDWSEAPEEIFGVEGHCGLLAAWTVLNARGKSIPLPELVRACCHTKRHGVFTVSLAAALTEMGLAVTFHTDPDTEVGGFERRCYARALRSGVVAQPALTLEELLYAAQQGHLPVVLFNTDSDEGHFSPLLGEVDGSLQLPLAISDSMAVNEFLIRWSAPGILRQCVVVL